MKLTDLYLKPEEIQKVYDKVGLIPAKKKRPEIERLDMAISEASANHAVKKVVKYLSKHNMNKSGAGIDRLWLCDDDWQALKKLVEKDEKGRTK